MEHIALLMFPALFVAILLGVPVAIAMLGVAFIFGIITFGDGVGYLLVSKIDELGSNFVFAAIPLFIFMGAVLESSGVAKSLFHCLQEWLRRVPGGLAISTMLLAVLFAASTGVAGATEAIVGLLAISPMLKARYNKALIAGTVCAGGSLGVLIPPSVVIIILGPLANVSVGDLLLASIPPSILLSGVYLLGILGFCALCPKLAPRDTGLARIPLKQLVRDTAVGILPPLVMIFLVLGSIIFGVAAPTEAAGLGAAGALALAAFRKELNLKLLQSTLNKTLSITCMIMFILLAGTLFTGVFVASGGAMLIQELVSELAVGPLTVVIVLLALCFIAGCFLDWISVTLLFIPIVLPVVSTLGFNPVWFCVLFMLVVQTSYLTPPMAPAIFYFKGISPPEITMRDMFIGVLPFILAQVLVLTVILIYPEVVTMLLG